ncbi:MAG: hypothetical protein SVR08_10460 [Spirochaetota bacterium]|nr:hypothetical protein [Spirochaetota bacterium]
MHSQKRERLRHKIVTLVHQLQRSESEEQAVDTFMDLMEDVEINIENLEENKASSHDIALLIQEMRAGFAQIDKRFEAVDKRFEAVDKRFEAVDKRFEDMMHFIDKRFEDMIHFIDKRFEAIDKRFEDMNNRFGDMNKRFNSLQWFMGIGFSFLALLITVLSYFARFQSSV